MVYSRIKLSLNIKPITKINKYETKHRKKQQVS